MLRSGFSAVRAVSRGLTCHSQMPSAVILCNHFSSKTDFNSALKDYALKQELKKDFTHYKEEADRREMFREVYLNLAKDGNKAMSEKVMNDKHCLLCNIPQNLISYMNVGLLRLFIHESGQMYSHHVTGTCKKHQRKIARCIKHARMAGLIPFQLTPSDYEFYDMVSGNQKKEVKEEKVEAEETLSEKLNKEGETMEDDVSSEDFVKLMHLLSAEEKDSE